MRLIAKSLSSLAVVMITLGFLSAQSTPPPTVPVPAYADTEVGLEQMMTDMLSLQKKGDVTALTPYLQSLILPDSERWFTSKFGDARCTEQQLGPDDCLGPRMALAYRPLAKALPASFSLTLADFLHEGLTNFEATNYTEPCPGPQRIVAARKLVGGLTTTPYLSSSLSGLVQHREPVYVLWAYSEDKETTLPFFVYSEGAFRYLGMLHPASDGALRKDAGPETDSVAPSAHYLSEDQLEMSDVLNDPSLVQRTVVLHVITGPKGKPKEVSYVRGPESARKAAIRKVKKRRFDLPPMQGINPGSFSFCVSEVAPQ